MKTYKLLIALIAALSSPSIVAEDMRTPEDSLWSSIQCGGKKVDLMVNHRTVAQPTLFVGENGMISKLEFSADACYSELACVNYQGRNSVHFVESSCGNAYEIYWVVDINSLEKHELDYSTAQKAGIINY